MRHDPSPPGHRGAALAACLLAVAACASPPPIASPHVAPTLDAPPVVVTPAPSADPATTGPAPELPARCADLFAAARDGDAERLRAWRDAGADLDAGCGSHTPLGLTALGCDADAAALLLDAGADANVCVPLPGRTTCGSGGALGGVTHGRYPLGVAESRVRDAERAGRSADACRAVRDLLAPRTGDVPGDLRPATPFR